MSNRTLTIQQVSNGFILQDSDDTALVYPSEAFIDLIRDLIDMTHGNGSRHDEKRLYVIYAPGDKHPNFTPEHAKVIWGDND